MKIEDLLREPNKDLALTKAVAAITIMQNALRFYEEGTRRLKLMKTEIDGKWIKTWVDAGHEASAVLKQVDEL